MHEPVTTRIKVLLHHLTEHQIAELQVAAQVDLTFITLSVCVEWIVRTAIPQNTSYIPHLMTITRCLRVLRLISLSKRMRILINTLMTVKNVIVQFFICYSLIIFAFASLALIIFEGNIPEDFDPNNGDNDDMNVLNPKVQLNTIEETTMALFQIAVTNNWQDIMYENCINGKTVGLWGAVFFVAYFISVVWLGTNIMTAVILDAYVKIVEKREKRQKAREERL